MKYCLSNSAVDQIPVVPALGNTAGFQGLDPSNTVAVASKQSKDNVSLTVASCCHTLIEIKVVQPLGLLWDSTVGSGILDPQKTPWLISSTQGPRRHRRPATSTLARRKLATLPGHRCDDQVPDHRIAHISGRGASPLLRSCDSGSP